MREDELDPGASTQMFQAFVDRAEAESSGTRRTGPLLGALLAGLVIVVAIAVLLLQG